MKNSNELKAWVRLLKVSGVGAKTFLRLLETFETPDNVFKANTKQLINSGIKENLALAIQENTENCVDEDIAWLEQSEKHHIITIQDDEYPSLLKQIDNPPPLLYLHGQYQLLNDPCIAIIGSRNPTQSGIDNAYEFAKYLAQTGFCINSGLALGIDGQSHKGALDVDAPTIAVIATGIDRVYPAKHRDLAHRIVKNGAIVSEFPIGTPPDSRNFPRRNRIISGLSLGTLVVEAAHKSGSLITARLAMEQNREVFAIPGSIHNPLARGCHQLIRQGAKLVETADDILEEMSSIITISDITSNQQRALQTEINSQDSEIKQNSSNLDEEHQHLLDEMGFDPIAIDQLVVRTGYNAENIAAMLLMLELQNQVSSNGGGTYTRIC